MNDTNTGSAKMNVGDTYLAGVSAPPETDKENEYVDASTGKSVGMFKLDVEKVTRHGVSMVRKDKWTAPKTMVMPKKEIKPVTPTPTPTPTPPTK